MTGNLPASTGLYVLTVWLLLVQPAAIALAAAAGLRRRRAGAGHPWHAAAAGWVAGVLFCAPVQEVLGLITLAVPIVVILSNVVVGAIALGWWLRPISATARRD